MVEWHNFYLIKRLLISFKTVKDSHLKLISVFRTLKLLNSKLIGQERDTEVSHIVQVYFSSVSLTLLESILCINILYNGSLICSKWPYKMLYQPNSFKIDSKISITISLTHFMKMYVDLYLKNISFYSLSCLPQKYNLERMSLILNNGDTYSQDQAGKLKY